MVWHAMPCHAMACIPVNDINWYKSQDGQCVVVGFSFSTLGKIMFSLINYNIRFYFNLDLVLRESLRTMSQSKCFTFPFFKQWILFSHRITKPEKTSFHLLHLSLFREYLNWEFNELKVRKEFIKILHEWLFYNDYTWRYVLGCLNLTICDLEFLLLVINVHT